MSKKIIIFAFATLCIASILSEDQNNASILEQTTTVPDVISKKSDAAPQKESPSIMSRIANWVFPFGGDSEAAETNNNNNAQQYLPPNNYQNQKDCNPCNKEPWIPVATNYGKNTIIGFMNPNNFRPPNGPVQNYGAPNSGPAQNYGPPQNYIPTQNYGPPKINQGPPLNQPVHVQPKPAYNVPNFQNPSLDNQYGPPENIRPPPIDNQYGPPSVNNQYGAPPIGPIPPNNHGPLNNHGALNNHGPSNNYGAPPNNHGNSPNNHGPPPNNYGPPPNNHGSPPNSHGPPPNHLSPPNGHGPPPNNQYGAPPTNNQYSAPPPNNQYGAPNNQFLPPSSINNQYGTPNSLPNHFGPPNLKPPGNFKPHNDNQYGPSKQVPIKVKTPKFIQPQQYPITLQSYEVANMKPPPLRNQNYATLPFDPPLADSVPINFYVAPNYRPPHNIKSEATHPDYIPPFEQLPLANNHINPIPFPNLSLKPVAPLHNPQPFYQQQQINAHQNGAHQQHQIGAQQQNQNVEIQQSISVTDYVASIEHPINVVHSPILEVDVANTSAHSEFGEDHRSVDYKLSNNPIIVDDAHAAASTYNGGVQENEKPRENHTDKLRFYNNLESGGLTPEFLSQIVKGVQLNEDGLDAQESFKNINTENYSDVPVPDYANWLPSTGPGNELPSSMLPPPQAESFWLTSLGYPSEVTTKKPKQIQIIIPYTTNNQGRKVPESFSLPVHTQPPSLESVWNQHTNDIYNGAESQEVTVTNKPTTEVINIKDFYKGSHNENHQNLPFDIIRFQKNIDDWTAQEYANKMLKQVQTSTTTTRLVPSKQIPDEYLTTLPYSPQENEVTTSYPRGFFDHDAAGSSSNEQHYKDDIETNLINSTTEEKIKPNWDKIQVAVSPLTKEKVYVVTPQPKLNTTDWESSNLSTKFAISIMPMKNNTSLDDIRIVLSEWPHLINNLETTTPTTTTATSKASRHPLFGFMDLSSYAPPENLTIHTYSGHSKVINAAAVTSATTKKKSTLEEKKVTTIKSTT